jgi:hypothetical protein
LDDYKCSHNLADSPNPLSRDTSAWGRASAWGHRLFAVVGFGHFQRSSVPFVFTIDECIEQKLDMLHRHTSQVYEWLAWHDGVLAEVPLGLERRREWLRARMITPFDTLVAEKYREVLVRWYGRRKNCDAFSPSSTDPPVRQTEMKTEMKTETARRFPKALPNTW